MTQQKPYIEMADELIRHAYSRFLTIDESGFTGDVLKAILETHRLILYETFQVVSYPLFPTEIEPSEQGRIKLHILSKILGTSSFAFPVGAESKYLGILEKGKHPPGNVSHGIPESLPGGQILPTAGSPVTQNLVTPDKPEFTTLLIGRGLLKGGVITYDGLLRHVASFIECDLEDVSINVVKSRVVEIETRAEVTPAQATVYNTFFAGLISHTGIAIRLKPNESS